MASDKDNNIYFYNPSLGASVLFAIIYIIPLIYQSYMTFIFPRKAQTPRTNYFIPTVIGAALEVAGYATRCASVQKPGNVGLYAVSSTIIVIAPVFVCASLYMLLGKLETSPDNGAKKPASFLRRGSGRWLPWVFLALDILAVLTQGSGSGIASSGNWEGSTKDTGIGVLIGGLVLQVVTFATYLVIMVWFHWRATVEGGQLPHGVRMVMKGVYIAGFFIMVSLGLNLGEKATADGKSSALSIVCLNLHSALTRTRLRMNGRCMCSRLFPCLSPCWSWAGSIRRAGWQCLGWKGSRSILCESPIDDKTPKSNL